MPQICTKCGEEKEPSEFYAYSPSCKLCKKNYGKQRYQKNRIKIDAVNREWSKKNIDKARKMHQKSYFKNKHKRLERQKKRNGELLHKCLDHYGHVCILCGAIENLCMDHIGGNNGDSPRCSSPLWRWIIKNNFPSIFRTLCLGCNTREAIKQKKEIERNEQSI